MPEASRDTSSGTFAKNMNDPWNPSADEIRRWAFSDEPWPEQDWDLAVNDGRNDQLLISLACDLQCPKREFFVHALYFMVGDLIHQGASDQRVDTVKGMFSVHTTDTPEDVLRWKREATALLSGSVPFDYIYWCDHMFSGKKCEQGGAVNPHAFGTFVTHPADAGSAPKASGDT